MQSHEFASVASALPQFAGLFCMAGLIEPGCQEPEVQGVSGLDVPA
jgi:hypothetical protein